MAIFGKDGTALPGEPRTNGSSGGEGSLSVIGTGMRVNGDIETDGVVKIEGHVQGNIRAARQVLVGRQGEVVGDIITREAVIGGTVHGSIQASERLEVQGTSSITGDIDTRAIAVIEGGKINGVVRIGDIAAGATPPESRSPAAAVSR